MSNAASSPLPLRPRIHVLATGGTIAGAHTGGAPGSYRSATLSIETLVGAVPQIAEMADLALEQVAQVGSQDMDDALWLELARRAGAALAPPGVAGLVITHGTDTMEETAYFLSLAVKTTKPMVLVGAMRPANAISADGPMNLYNAIAVACDPGATSQGALVVANDEIHHARAVSKTNTTQVGTFHSINQGLAGLVNQGRVHWFGPAGTQHTLASEFSADARSTLPRVEIVFAHAGMDRTLIDAAVAAGAEGIVIAGVGSGNLHALARTAAAEAAAKGICIVRASRTGGGMVERSVEVDDDRFGFVAAGDLNPQKARVLLKLALTRTHSPALIQEMFDRY